MITVNGNQSELTVVVTIDDATVLRDLPARSLGSEDVLILGDLVQFRLTATSARRLAAMLCVGADAVDFRGAA